MPVARWAGFCTARPDALVCLRCRAYEARVREASPEGERQGQAQPLQDFVRDCRRCAVHVDDDRVFFRRRFFKDCELTVEQGDGHEVLVPRRQTGMDQLV